MHHVARQPGAMPRVIYHRAAISMPRVSLPPHAGGAWQRALARGGLALLRRPLLALALIVAGLLLFSAASEAVAAGRLAAQVQAAQQTNVTLQAQLTATAAQIHDRSNPAAIVAAAQKLGWVLPTPTSVAP